MPENSNNLVANESGAEPESRRRRRILAVGVEPALFGRIEALLNRRYFEVDRVPRGESGRILCAAIAFDLVLVRVPLPDLEVSELLDALRAPESPCRKSQVLLLADEEQLIQVETQFGRGVEVILSAGKTAELLTEVAARLLQVAPRIAARIMVRLQAQLHDGNLQALCQTVNLSASGMLVRTDARYPLGTSVQFQIQLPEQSEAVVGTAEVVRHTEPELDKLDGVGLRYVEFRAGGEARLHAFLERTLFRR